MESSSLTLLAMANKKRPGLPGRFRFSQYLPKTRPPQAATLAGEPLPSVLTF